MIDAVKDLLAGHGYGLVAVEATEPFVVVVEQYTDHPRNVREECILERSLDGHNCFLMPDRERIEKMVMRGATLLAESDVENPFQ